MINAPIRILIADDHPQVRRQLRLRLGREPGFVVASEAKSSMEAVDCALVLRPDIVLIDPIMHDGYGLQAIQRLVAELPRSSVVVLTAFTDTAMQMALREMGVARILAKDLDVPDLIAVLKSVAAQDRIDPRLQQAV